MATTTLEERMARVEGILEELRTRVTQLENRVEARFNQVESRFNQVDARFNQIDTKFNWVFGLIITTWLSTLATLLLLFFRR